MKDEKLISCMVTFTIMIKRAAPYFSLLDGTFLLGKLSPHITASYVYCTPWLQAQEFEGKTSITSSTIEICEADTTESFFSSDPSGEYSKAIKTRMDLTQNTNPLSEIVLFETDIDDLVLVRSHALSELTDIQIHGSERKFGKCIPASNEDCASLHSNSFTSHSSGCWRLFLGKFCAWSRHSLETFTQSPSTIKQCQIGNHRKSTMIVAVLTRADESKVRQYLNVTSDPISWKTSGIIKSQSQHASRRTTCVESVL